MSKTCPILSNYGDMRCRLKPYLIRQVDQVALQVPSHIGWVCFLNCLSHCLVARPGIYYSAKTSFLSVSFIHQLYVYVQPSHQTNSSFVPTDKIRLCKTFSMRYWLSKISCSCFRYKLPFTASSL